MKRREDFDRHAHNELVLYADNERDILVNPASNKYKKEFGYGFSPPTRKGVAKAQLRDMLRGILKGDY